MRDSSKGLEAKIPRRRSRELYKQHTILDVLLECVLCLGFFRCASFTSDAKLQCDMMWLPLMSKVVGTQIQSFVWTAHKRQKADNREVGNIARMSCASG